ncbi:MAG: hypothetical protein QW232_10480 [Saccharolobus sp.]
MTSIPQDTLNKIKQI